MTDMLTRVARVIDPEAWDALRLHDTPLFSVRRAMSLVKAHGAIEIVRDAFEGMISAALQKT